MLLKFIKDATSTNEITNTPEWIHIKTKSLLKENHADLADEVSDIKKSTNQCTAFQELEEEIIESIVADTTTKESVAEEEKVEIQKEIAEDYNTESISKEITEKLQGRMWWKIKREEKRKIKRN